MKSEISSITDLENLTFLYKLTSEEILTLKKNQWAITLYSILLNILVFLVYRILGTTATIIESYVCIGLCIAIAFTGICYLVVVQGAINKLKLRILRIHKHMPSDKYVILEKPSLRFTSVSFQIYDLVIPFILVLVFCPAIISFIILR